MESPELSIIMPCLNEAETLETCIRKAKKFLADNKVSGEVVIGDNGSTDGSQEIARRNGAIVIDVPLRGYGNAIKGAIAGSTGKYIAMGDSDDSYDFLSLMPFLEKMRQGYDLCMGNRFKGGIAPGAMPFLHKYLGNPVLSFIGRLFFGGKMGDFHCGLRMFSRDAYYRMDVQTTGMEFASELVVKAMLLKMKITEVPTTLQPDGRSRPPHLRTWRDGWRHLRFLLMYAPKWLFLYPGLFLILFGLIIGGAIAIKPLEIGNITLDVDTMVYMGIAVLAGFQAVSAYAMAKVFAINEGLLPEDKRLANIIKKLSLENGLILSGILIVAGLVGSIMALMHWKGTGFSDLNTSVSMRIIIPSVLALMLGIQMFFTSFLIGILGLKREKN